MAYFSRFWNKIHIPKIIIIEGIAQPTPKVSYDFGVSWSSLGQITTMNYANPRHLKINKTLGTLLCVTNTTSTDNAGFISSDNGLTWDVTDSYSATHLWPTCISKNGLALFTARTHATEYLHYSYDGGLTWSQNSSLAAQPRGIACNYDGSIVVIVSQAGTTGYGRYSLNSCSSFNSFNQPFITDSAICNESGNLWIISNFTSTDSIIAYSSDNGSNWTQITLGTGLASSVTELNSSSNCKYILACRSDRAFISNNYGVSGSWIEVLSEIRNFNIYNSSVSESGQYMLIGHATTGHLWLSVDYGINWTDITVTGTPNITTAAIQ